MCWLIGRLIDWLVDPFVHWLIDWLVDRVVDPWIDCLIDWLNFVFQAPGLILSFRISGLSALKGFMWPKNNFNIVAFLFAATAAGMNDGKTDERVFRTCGYLGSGNETEKPYIYRSSEAAKSEVYSCFTDDCNSAGSLQASVVVALATMLLGLLALWMGPLRGFSPWILSKNSSYCVFPVNRAEK